jgi:FlaG/FlaF family flagellin (archaellin)
MEEIKLDNEVKVDKIKKKDNVMALIMYIAITAALLALVAMFAFGNGGNSEKSIQTRIDNATNNGYTSGVINTVSIINQGTNNCAVYNMSIDTYSRRLVEYDNCVVPAIQK